MTNDIPKAIQHYNFQKGHAHKILGRVFRQTKSPAGWPKAAKNFDKPLKLSKLRNDTPKAIQNHNFQYLNHCCFPNHKQGYEITASSILIIVVF